MKQSNKKPISLKTKAFRAILAGTLLLTLLISGAFFGLYVFDTLRNFHDEAENLMNYAMSMEDMTYIERIFKETREIYEGLPADVKKDPTSEAFMDAFRPLVDDDFYAAREILLHCWEETNNRNMSLVFTDPELSALVYVVDGDELEWAFLPGQWITGDMEEIEKVCQSDWRLRITHTPAYGWVGTDYRKITAEDGRELGYVVIDIDINDFFNKVRRFLAVVIPVAVFWIVLTALEASILLRKHVIDQVTGLAAAAKAYTDRDKLENLEEKESHFARLNMYTGDEFEDLWRTMTEMETDIGDTMRRLVKVTTEQERMNAELSIATEIQVGTLPHTFPAFPDRQEFDIYASMVPAKEVGGDFYDYFLIDEDHLALVIADVSGKGISAALFMISAKEAIQNQTQAGELHTDEILARVNEHLCAQNKAEMFVTVWLGILEISTGRVLYANAGHEYPAIRRAGQYRADDNSDRADDNSDRTDDNSDRTEDNSDRVNSNSIREEESRSETGDKLFCLEKDVHSMPVAAMEGMRFKASEFTLSPGDTLFVYTDGVTEANNTAEELFGTERMLAALNRQPDAEPKELDKNVREALKEFGGGAPQFDDITMLCLKYFGDAGRRTDGRGGKDRT